MSSHTLLQVCSEAEMIELGQRIATQLSEGIICFEGDLGAGKTTFIKGFLSQHLNLPKAKITSPTFNIINFYDDILHFDCYRLQDAREFLARGLDDHLLDARIALIEWPSKIKSIIPPNAVWITISILSHTSREVRIHGL
ncbi:MAG: tRNA (adenosine(37)-N6)-threonylcarbamoyltransferase complex ATPase subunit type 1 TsaE [Simkaniaceae bacterium]|nr:tRNA (adenosine(37)-N6)-threonylcarbamoyltransferase complex ATPase subunit type 1 TsaE [Simkaniaceae bacterium]